MKNLKKRIALLTEARQHAAKMQKGSVFVTDFKAVQLINRLVEEMQNILSENLRLEEQLKTKVTFSKEKKDK